MKLFKYMQTRCMSETLAIYNAVQDLKPYAISIYKNTWEDVLDASFEHIIKHYDSSKGDLEHYAMVIVKTIESKNEKEVSYDAEEQQGVISEAQFKMQKDADSILTKSSDVQSCEFDLVPYFVKDYRFFESGKGRTLNYKKIFDKYENVVIQEAAKHLTKEYLSSLKATIEYVRKSHVRKFNQNIYKKNFSMSYQYVGVINQTLLVKRHHKKSKVYKVNLKHILSLLKEDFYGEDSKLILNFAGRAVYVSPGGVFVFTEKELMHVLEYEIVNTLLVKLNINLFHHLEGDCLLFFSIKERPNVSISIFDEEISLSFEKVVYKEV